MIKVINEKALECVWGGLERLNRSAFEELRSLILRNREMNYSKNIIIHPTSKERNNRISVM